MLDIIAVEFDAPAPLGHQTENEVIDHNYYWEFRGKLTIADVAALIDKPLTLWGTGSSTYSGQNDRVPAGELLAISNSLNLIPVSSLLVQVRAEGAAFGNNKKKVRGTFNYRGHTYALMITDPVVEDEYLALGLGQYEINENLFLCVSLAELHEGFAYKLIASIIKS